MNRTPDFLYQAAWNLRNGNHFSITENELKWSDDSIDPPLESEIQSEMIRLQNEYEAASYQRNRQPKYPPIVDFIDAMYWASNGDTTKLDTYYAACTAVKNKYPKPQ